MNIKFDESFRKNLNGIYEDEKSKLKWQLNGSREKLGKIRNVKDFEFY